MSKLKHPAPEELTVVVLGGSGQGESIVIHIGDGHWIVIDSYDSQKQSLPYLYLNAIGANFENVEFVICTHWHSDHVKGLYQILSSCPNAKFFVPGVTGSKFYPEFFAGNVYKSELSEEGIKTVIDEFNSCMKYAIDSNIIEYLERDRTIIKREVHGQHLEVSSVSPSAEMKNRFHRMFASKNDGNYKEYGIEPNMCSSAIVVSVNDSLHLLLGADLESNRPEDDHDYTGCLSQCEKRKLRGWCNTIKESQIHNYLGKYNYVKIAHHSSENGYCPKLWQEKVRDDVIGVTTIFNANLLPQPDMISIYASKCKEYYISAPPIQEVENTSHDEINTLKKEGVLKTISSSIENSGTIESKFSFNTQEYLGTELEGTAYLYQV